jgi:hypothetical protein
VRCAAATPAHGISTDSPTVTTLGIILQTTGFILKEWAHSTPPALALVIYRLGWVTCVTGLSIVLWSRLHLVVTNRRILRGVLVLIIVNGILMHTSIIVLDFVLLYRFKLDLVQPASILEYTQQTVFTVQECLISILYIFYTYKFLNTGYATHTRKVVLLLGLVQVVVIALDAMLAVIDYKHMFTLKFTLHPFVYALKLKLEFIVLNQLLALVKSGLQKPQGIAGPYSDLTNSAMEDSIRGVLPNITLSEMERLKASHTFITKSPVAAGRVPDDEFDLKAVVGSPDGDGMTRSITEVSDLERQYLGRYAHGGS